MGARRQVVSVTGGVANSATVPVNHRAETFAIGFGCVVDAGATLTYKVQHTFDDIYEKARTGGTVDWFDHATVTGKTANSDGNYAFPVTAIRIAITAWTSGGVTLTILENV
jgi:hypothetical protein